MKDGDEWRVGGTFVGASGIKSAQDEDSVYVYVCICVVGGWVSVL